jgi:hypothetical protein
MKKMKKKRTPKRSKAAARAGLKRELPKAIADVVGAVDGLPADLSERKKHYLKIWGYGRDRPRR